MAELTHQERLQPSLLDRLTDDAPGRMQEGRERRAMSASRLRECVMRDLSWLLNCVKPDADLTAYPEVSRSVLNFGIPDLTGATLSGIDAETLQRRVREAILVFEPRLADGSLQVTARAGGTDMARTSLMLDIEARMWALPLPLNLYLKTEVDLETGKLVIREGVG